MQKVASSRSFGLLLTAIAASIAGFAYWMQSRSFGLWSAVAIVLLAIALLIPRVLAPLKRLWLRFGRFIHLALNPIILGIVYVLVFIPFGVMARLLRKDPLSLRRDFTADTYWIKRSGSPDASALKDQF